MPIKQPMRKPQAPATTGRTLPKPGAAPADEGGGEDEQPTGAASKEDAFDSAEPESGFGLPNGNYVAHLIKCGVDRTTPPKESVRFDFEIAEGEQEGKTVVAWYSLFDKQGNQMKGIGYFKRDMEVLGQPAFKFADIDDALATLEAERVKCNITGKQNGQFFNIFLQGLAEG